MMSVSEPAIRSSRRHQKLRAAIFDVDGVLLASPHERAWREALEGFVDPVRFTSDMYEDQVAGKPRLTGAVAALEALGVPNPHFSPDIASSGSDLWRTVETCQGTFTGAVFVPVWRTGA